MMLVIVLRFQIQGFSSLSPYSVEISVFLSSPWFEEEFKKKDFLLSARWKSKFSSQECQKERCSQRNDGNDDNCVSPVEERKIDYCGIRVHLERAPRILGRGLISEHCVNPPSCPRIRPRQTLSPLIRKGFYIPVSLSLNMMMDPQLPTSTTRHTSASSCEKEFFTHCRSPHPEQTQHSPSV